MSSDIDMLFSNALRTGGIRKGELVLVCSAAGVGTSRFKPQDIISSNFLVVGCEVEFTNPVISAKQQIAVLPGNVDLDLVSQYARSVQTIVSGSKQPAYEYDWYQRFTNAKKGNLKDSTEANLNRG